MNVYALRRTGPDKYLPARASGRRGFSNDTPEPMGGVLGPRLFVSKHAARCALVAWMQGVFVMRRSVDWETQTEEGYVAIEPQCGRDPGTMEVVTFALCEIT